MQCRRLDNWFRDKHLHRRSRLASIILYDYDVMGHPGTSTTYPLPSMARPVASSVYPVSPFLH